MPAILSRSFDFLTHTVQMKQKRIWKRIWICQNFLTHTVQMKQLYQCFMTTYIYQLLNPHGSDETTSGSVEVITIHDLLNPHGSDETWVFHACRTLRRILLNPHGSDETINHDEICVASSELLNPHGSDETWRWNSRSVHQRVLLNPHGSDETPLQPAIPYPLLDFLTHTVQMKQYSEYTA